MSMWGRVPFGWVPWSLRLIAGTSGFHQNVRAARLGFNSTVQVPVMGI